MSTHVNGLAPSSQQVVYDGLSLSLTPAPVSKRFLAYGIDLGIVLAIIYPLIIGVVILVSIIIGGAAVIDKLVSLGDGAKGFGAVMLMLVFMLIFLSILAIQDFYFIYFERKSGTTPGKKMFGIKVVSIDGAPVSFGQAVLRDFMRYIDCFLIFPGLLSVVISERRRRLGDFLAGTVVIHSVSREQAEKSLYLGREEFESLADSIKPTVIDPRICELYLKFSFPYFVMHDVSRASEVQYWEPRLRQYVGGQVPPEVDQQLFLRFFAEHCFHQSTDN